MDSPLLARPGAVPADPPDQGIAAHYGDPFAEQRALAQAAGLVDRSDRDVVKVTGQDRLTWLNSLSSQKLDDLGPGTARQALILSPHGHVEHHLSLVDDGTTTWMHLEPAEAAPLLEFLASMRFMMRVTESDVTSDYAVLTTMGPQAAGAGAAGVAAALDFGFGTDLIVERARLSAVTDGLEAAGAVVAGLWAHEALRIAGHRARFGVDTDHRTIPHEVGWIEQAVHLNKGCYRGQETVARVHNLGHPPRRLVLLHLDGSESVLPAHGDEVSLDGKAVGFVGSAARHYELGPIALALVKRTVPVEATLLTCGVTAAQEVIVSPDAGANVKVTMGRRRGLL
ncbi:MAG TPA: glycine cleavage T C-terminal barrel domain-containing protein [Streptosporangiaceae bacterium]